MFSRSRSQKPTPDRDRPGKHAGKRRRHEIAHRNQSRARFNEPGSRADSAQATRRPGGRQYEYVCYTGGDFLMALFIANGTVALGCLIHAVLFLPPYGLLYDGPAKPGYQGSETFQEAPHQLPQSAGSQSANSDDPLALDIPGDTAQSSSDQKQSTSDNPLFFDTDEDKDTGRTDDTDKNGDDAGSQSAAPPSRISDDTTPPAAPQMGGPLTEPMAYGLSQHFLHTLEWGWNTGDTGPLSLMAAPNCSYCQTIKEDITSTHTDSRTIQGVHYEILDGARTLKVEPPQAARTTWVVIVPIRISEHVIIEKAQLKRVAPTETTLEINFQEVDNAWKVTAFGPAVVDSPKNQE